VLSVASALLGCSGGGQAVEGDGHRDPPVDAGSMPSTCPTHFSVPPSVPPEDTGPTATCPPAWPSVSNNGADSPSVLSVVTITTAGDPAADDLASFGSDLVASSWWSLLAQTYALDPAPTAIHWIGPAIPPSKAGEGFTQDDVESYIRGVIQDPSAAVPAPPAAADPIYMLYLPAGVTLVTNTGENTDCRFIGGYHFFGSLESRDFAYGVAQRCERGVTLGPGPSPMQRLTLTGSHEIAEAATDPHLDGYRVAPDPVGPWVSPVNGEVGDLCASAWHVEGQWMYQRFWSNASAAGGGDPCVPGPATPPPVFVGAAWTALPASHRIRLPLTGCNLPADTIWRLAVSVTFSDPSVCGAVWIQNRNQTSYPSALIPPAAQPSLLIALDPGAPSGSSAYVTLTAHAYDMNAPNVLEPEGVDLYSVGVFVP
jgi:hypothetical protein